MFNERVACRLQHNHGQREASDAMQKFLWTAVVLAVTGGALADDAAPNAEELFRKLDANADGKVTADELTDDQKRYFERALRLGDENGDGALTREEFVKGLRPAERPQDRDPSREQDSARRSPAERNSAANGTEEQFRQLDRDGDGKATLEEIPEGFRERVRPLFQRAGKESLTLEDFRRLRASTPPVREMVRRLDANGDGKLTLEELPERMRERMKAHFERAGKESLTEEEFSEALLRLWEEQRRQNSPEGEREREPVAELFRRFDANADGKITLDELPEPMRERMQPAFERLGKEELTREEFTGILSRFGQQDRLDRENARREGDRPRNGERPMERPEGFRRPDSPPRPGVFRLLDADGDGRISREELDDAAERLKELDRNGDGYLEPREMFGFQAGDRPPFGGFRPENRPSTRPRREEGGERGDEPRPRREGTRRPNQDREPAPARRGTEV